MANPPEVQEMVALFDAGRFVDALAKVEAYLAANAELGMAWRFKGECLSKLDRWAEAIPCYAKADALGGRAAQGALLGKATAEWNAGRFDEARATADSIVANEGGRHGETVVASAVNLLKLMAATRSPGG